MTNTHHRSRLLACLILVSTFAWSLSASANEDLIKYRQAIYGGIGKHTGAIASILKGDVPHTDDLPALARGLSELAALTPDLFAENTQEGKTDALPEIWENFDEFQGLIDDFIDDTALLVEASASGNRQDFARAFQRVGRGCKGCHDRFKAD